MTESSPSSPQATQRVTSDTLDILIDELENYEENMPDDEYNALYEAAEHYIISLCTERGASVEDKYCLLGEDSPLSYFKQHLTSLCLLYTSPSPRD